MNKVFFLSHSTKDNDKVVEIAKLLGDELCWLSEWEVKPGESIFKFDRGIADSRIFVLFWSKNTLLSQWVNEETNQARIRLTRDKGFHLIVVKLDDTPLPNSLAYRSYIDGAKGIDNIIEDLKSVENNLTPEEVYVGKPLLKDSFQNRQQELDRFEELAFSESYGGVMILGPDGMGKTSLVKRAIPLIFSNLTPLWIDLKAASTPIRLLSSFANPLSIMIDPDIAATEPNKVWRNILLPEIAQSDKMFIVLDNMNINIFEGRNIVSLINTICEDLAELNKPKNPNVVIISWELPPLNQITLAKYGSLRLGQLHEKAMIRALRFHISHTSVLEYESEKLELIAKQLKGYPLALNLAALEISERGIDAVVEDKDGMSRMVSDLAQELFSHITITQEEKKPLVFLATSMYPLSANYLKILLGDEWSLIIDRIAKKQLLDPTSGGYSLHNILAYYILVSVATPQQIMECHKELGELFKVEWQKAPENSAISAQFGSLAYFHSLSSGQESVSEIIRIAYLEEAKEASIELYKRGQYSIALAYLENIRKIDKQPDPIYDFYYALTLNKLGKSKEALPIMQELVDKFPSISRYHQGLGTVLKRMHDYQGAIISFRKAVSTSSYSRKYIPLSSLADVLCEQDNPDEALPLIKEAQTIAPTNSAIVAIMSTILEKIGDIKGALDIIMEALKRSPIDARLNHRAGVLLKRIGRLHEAKRHLEIAVSNTGMAFSFTALADVYIQLGNINEAERILEKFPGEKMNDTSYLSTKGNIQRLKKEFREAEKFIKKAIRLEPNNTVHYGGLAQLKYDQAQDYILNGEKQNALISIEEAKNLLAKGLELDRNNNILLTIKHTLDELELKIGLK